MSAYDDLIRVTMTITGRALPGDQAMEDIERTIRRFVRDDIRHELSTTFSDHDTYEVTVTLWPAAVPEGCTCGRDKHDPTILLTQDLGCPVHGVQASG